MKNKESVDLGMDFSSAPSFVAATPDTSFLLDVASYIAYPQVKCTDKGAIYLKDKKEISDIGTPAARGTTRSQTLDVILAFINPTIGRVYVKKYNPSAPGIDCSSNRGVTPSLRTFNPVSDVCATCPMSQWGESETGSKTAPACKNTRNVAVLPLTEDGVLGVHIHRVSGVSEKHTAKVKAHLQGADFGAMLKKLAEVTRAGNSLHGIVVELSTVELPPGGGTIGQVWAYKLKRWATAEEFAAVQVILDDEGDRIKDSIYQEDRPLPLAPARYESPSVDFFSEV